MIKNMLIQMKQIRSSIYRNPVFADWIVNNLCKWRDYVGLHCQQFVAKHIQSLHCKNTFMHPTIMEIKGKTITF